MTTLDALIKQKAYELDSLRLLRTILESGDCNGCDRKDGCPLQPKPGQLVRYNCPHYRKKGAKNEH